MQTTTVCIVNRAVTRILIQNQGFMSQIRTEYMTGDIMSNDDFVRLSRDFSITPSLCKESDVQDVLDACHM
jgi:hypothetical protein